MKIVAIIPSRYGSSRFAGKPLARIAGKPMIERVYENVKMARRIADVVVATDDQRIFEVVKGFDGKAVMTGKESRTGTDRVAEATDLMGLDHDDIIINIQGDQPCIVPQHIEDVINPFENGLDFEMSTLAYKIVNPEEITNPKDCKVTFDSKGYALYFSRSPIPCARDAGTVFDTYKHLGIYAYTRRFLEVFRRLPAGRLESIEKLEQLRALEYGYRIFVVTTQYDSPEVDLPEDISRIEKMIGKEGSEA